MKKLIALLLTFVMLIALCACGSTAAPANDPGLTENTTSAESVVWKISCVDAEGSDYGLDGVARMQHGDAQA